MSYGKTTPATKDLTPEQRIEVLESVIPALRERLQTYDSAIGEVRQVKSSLEGQTSRIAELETLLRNLLNEFNAHKSETSKVHSNLNSSISELNGTLSAVKSALTASISSVTASLENSKSVVQQQMNDKLGSTELERVKKDLYSSISELRSEIKGNSFDIATLVKTAHNQNDKNYASEGKFSLLDSSLQAVTNDINALKSNIISSRADAKSSLDTHTLEVSSHIASALEPINKRLQDLKTEASGSSYLESLKTELSKKMESIALDASNAALRASNSSQQILILEKKIENINLLLKKHELTQ